MINENIKLMLNAEHYIDKKEGYKIVSNLRDSAIDLRKLIKEFLIDKYSINSDIELSKTHTKIDKNCISDSAFFFWRLGN